MRRLEDDFEVLGVLGEGGFGRAYHVREKKTGKEWAAKVLIATDADARKRFRREVMQLEMYRGIRHVMKVAVGVLDAEPPYFIMPLVKGGTLQQHIGKLNQSQILSVMRQLMETLQHIHAMDGIHRDVKPANILMQGAATLADFGLGNAPGCTVTFTANGAGTHGYVAPEVLRGASCSWASDVFSAGATWFHVVTGKHPANLPLPLDPRTVRPDWPSPDCDWIRAMTDPSPWKRPMAYQVVAGIQAGLPAGDVMLPTEKPKDYSGWAALGFGALAVLGVVALARAK